MRLSVALRRVVIEQQKVSTRVARKERRVLFRSGAYVRTTMRRKIRKAPKRPRGPSKYPRYHGHSKTGLRDVHFKVDENAGTVVTGPRRYANSGNEKFTNFYRGRRWRSFTTGGQTIPQLLNQGGTAVQVTEWLSGTVVRRQMNYRPQPYRDDSFPPALDKFRDLMGEVPL